MAARHPRASVPVADDHSATSVYIHLKQENYEFEGFYAGNALVHHPIDQTAWASALTGNGGDPLHVDIKIADANNVYGPISEDWLVASGVLKGTVYYNSYNTRLAQAIPGAGPTRARRRARHQARSERSDVALPGTEKHCVVATRFRTTGRRSSRRPRSSRTSDNYPDGASYDLTNNGAVIQKYTGNAPEGPPTTASSCGRACRKTAPSRCRARAEHQEAYGGDSRIFRRDNGNAVTARDSTG